MTCLEQAPADGYAKISGEGKTVRIHYLDADHSERWADREEKVRARVQSHTGERIAADEEAAGACSTFVPAEMLFARLRPCLRPAQP